MDHVFSSESFSLVCEGRELILSALQTVKLVCMDGNLSATDIRAICEMCIERGIGCWFEPTTPQKSLRILQAGMLHAVDYVSPNVQELDALAEGLETSGEVCSVAVRAEKVLRKGGGGVRGQRLLVTCGAEGVRRFVLKQSKGEWSLAETRFVGERVNVDASTTGAGDCFAGVCMAGLARGVPEDEAIRLGMRAAEDKCGSGNDRCTETGAFAKL